MKYLIIILFSILFIKLDAIPMEFAQSISNDSCEIHEKLGAIPFYDENNLWLEGFETIEQHGVSYSLKVLQLKFSMSVQSNYQIFEKREK